MHARTYAHTWCKLTPCCKHPIFENMHSPRALIMEIMVSYIMPTLPGSSFFCEIKSTASFDILWP